MAGMIVINMIARDEGGSVGFKGTMAVGAYGGAIGLVVGVTTCH